MPKAYIQVEKIKDWANGFKPILKSKLRSGSNMVCFTWREATESRGDSRNQYQQVSTIQQQKKTSAVMTFRDKQKERLSEGKYNSTVGCAFACSKMMYIGSIEQVMTILLKQNISQERCSNSKLLTDTVFEAIQHFRGPPNKCALTSTSTYDELSHFLFFLFSCVCVCVTNVVKQPLETHNSNTFHFGLTCCWSTVADHRHVQHFFFLFILFF